MVYVLIKDGVEKMKWKVIIPYIAITWIESFAATVPFSPIFELYWTTIIIDFVRWLQTQWVLLQLE